MSIFLALVIAILCIGLLWLSAKFMGKSGIFILSAVLFLIMPLFNLLCEPVVWLGGGVELSIIFFITSIFGLIFLTRQYGIGQGIKLGTVMVVGSFTLAFFLFVILLFAGAPFGSALESALLPWMILMLALTATLVVGVLLSKVFTWSKITADFKDFLIFCVMLAAYVLVYGMLSQIGHAAFGQMLLNCLITLFTAILYAGALLIFAKLALRVNEHPVFDSVLKDKFDKVSERVKNATIKKEENKAEEAKKTDDAKEAEVPNDISESEVDKKESDEEFNFDDSEIVIEEPAEDNGENKKE